MTSSLYPPNTAMLEKFQQLGEVTRVVRTERVRTQRLDDLAEVADADWLKMDVQGADLSVIKGAQRVLREVVMVQSEVEFVPLYLGQPLFAEVDQAMRRSGFSSHPISPEGVSGAGCSSPFAGPMASSGPRISTSGPRRSTSRTSCSCTGSAPASCSSWR